MHSHDIYSNSIIVQMVIPQEILNIYIFIFYHFFGGKLLQWPAAALDLFVSNRHPYPKAYS